MHTCSRRHSPPLPSHVRRKTLARWFPLHKTTAPRCSPGVRTSFLCGGQCGGQSCFPWHGCCKTLASWFRQPQTTAPCCTTLVCALLLVDDEFDHPALGMFAAELSLPVARDAKRRARAATLMCALTSCCGHSPSRPSRDCCRTIPCRLSLCAIYRTMPAPSNLRLSTWMA